MTLKSKLDKLFSEYIRRREADENGYVKCFTCGKIKHWKKQQCGHYYSRRFLSTRYDEMNCNVQCVQCNIFKEGNKPVFYQKLIEKYGEDKINLLYIKKDNTAKFTDTIYRILILEYKQKIKELENKQLN